jgi:hypothetical protein
MIIDAFFIVCLLIAVFVLGLSVGYFAGFSSEKGTPWVLRGSGWLWELEDQKTPLAFEPVFEDWISLNVTLETFYYFLGFPVKTSIPNESFSCFMHMT